MSLKYWLPLFVILLGLWSCSPKTGQETAATEEETEQPETTPDPSGQEEAEADLSSCPKFKDAKYPDEVETNYVLYRDRLKTKEWDQAFELWQKVYEVAPAADGRRRTVFSDGVRLYERFLGQTDDTRQKKAYLDTIFSLYDEMERCYPEESFPNARKGFDLYYKYSNLVDDRKEIYDYFKKCIDAEGLNTPDFVLNPFTALLVELYFEDRISMEEARQYQAQVRNILEKGLAECEGKACDRWETVKAYAPSKLENFETVRGFYDCDYYEEKYYDEYLANPDDCNVIRTVFSRLKWGGCGEESEKLQELVEIGNEKCRPDPGPARQGYNCLREADYQCAIEKFEEAAQETDNAERKGDYLMTIAQIYQSHLRNFPKSRQYARRAAEARPNWGEPYIHIGNLYASSGPLCGPGRGWDSQVVVWPAIDMWRKAKQVDPDVTKEANKWIRQYAQYMPSKEDIFQRNLSEGDTFTVACWIQETTRIRAARN